MSTNSYFRVVGWHDRFENSTSRKLKALSFVLIANDQSDIAYRRVASMPDGAAILGAWLAVVQIASRGSVAERGALVKGGEALDADDLSLASGLPVKVFQRALEVLSNPKIGWLEKVAGPAPRPGSSATVPGDPPDALGDPPGSPGDSANGAGSSAENLPPKEVNKDGRNESRESRESRERRTTRNPFGARAANAQGSARPLPDDFEPSDHHHYLCKTYGLHLSNELLLFATHARESGRTAACWSAAFERWLHESSRRAYAARNGA